MNFLDFIILIPLVYFSYKGFRNGLIMEIVALLSLIAGIYIAIRFSAWVGECIGVKGESAALIAFIITFIGVLLGVYLLGKAVESLAKKLSLDFINRLGGLCFGLLKTLLIVGLLIFFCHKVDPHQHILSPATRQKSFFFYPIEKVTYQVWPVLQSLNNQFKTI